VNPPISASTTPTFHKTFDPADFSLRPNFVSRDDPVAAAGCPVAAGHLDLTGVADG
jgi:nitric-oxide synthase